MTRIFIPGPEVTVSARPRIQARRASEVEAKPIDWLWEPHIALGMFSMIVFGSAKRPSTYLYRITLTRCSSSGRYA